MKIISKFVSVEHIPLTRTPEEMEGAIGPLTYHDDCGDSYIIHHESNGVWYPNLDEEGVLLFYELDASPPIGRIFHEKPTQVSDINNGDVHDNDNFIPKSGGH